MSPNRDQKDLNSIESVTNVDKNSKINMKKFI